jgi:hypothetical protein
MAHPSREGFQKLVAELNDVAKTYSDSPDLDGYMSRVQILGKAKEITQSLISPDQVPYYHGRNVCGPTTHHPACFSAIFLTHMFPLDGRGDCYTDIYEAPGLREDTT